MVQKDLTVIGHLEELRRRIVVSLAVLLGASVLCLPFASAILQVLKFPSHGAIERLVYFGPEEAFLIYMRISIIAGFVISFPMIAYQVWAFISPAVTGGLKKYSVFFVLVSTAVFVLGCVFAFFALVPAALGFLLNVGRGELEPVISASRYISFVTGMMLACGVVFEMPVAAFFLARVGVLRSSAMRRQFKYAFVVIMIAAAIITPTSDVFNMMLLAVPMLCLYGMSVWVASLAESRKAGYVQ